MLSDACNSNDDFCVPKCALKKERKKEQQSTKQQGIVRVVTRRKENAQVRWNRGIGSKCFLKRDKFPFVREDILCAKTFARFIISDHATTAGSRPQAHVALTSQ